jgi:hypothetical protein
MQGSYNTGLINIGYCTVSNKYTAFLGIGGNFIFLDPSGTGNRVVFHSDTGCLMRVYNAGNIEGITKYSKTKAGIIVLPDTTIYGTAPIASPVFTGTPKVGQHPVAVVSIMDSASSEALPVGSIILCWHGASVSPNTSLTPRFASGGSEYTTSTTNTTALGGTWRVSGRINYSINNYGYLLRRVA